MNIKTQPKQEINFIMVTGHKEPIRLAPHGRRFLIDGSEQPNKL